MPDLNDILKMAQEAQTKLMQAQADFDKVSIATLLLPSGMGGDENLNQKFKFMDDFSNYLDKQRRKRRDRRRRDDHSDDLIAL